MPFLSSLPVYNKERKRESQRAIFFGGGFQDCSRHRAGSENSWRRNSSSGEGHMLWMHIASRRRREFIQ